MEQGVKERSNIRYGTFQTGDYGRSRESVVFPCSSYILSSHLLYKDIHNTVSLPVISYGCETWYLTLTEEHIVRAFENRVLREIFGSKRDETTGGWRKLHNEELHNLYSSPNIRMIKSRVMRWGVHKYIKIMAGKPEGK
jgi:hypothetical protein